MVVGRLAVAGSRSLEPGPERRSRGSEEKGEEEEQVDSGSKEMEYCALAGHNRAQASRFPIDWERYLLGHVGDDDSEVACGASLAPAKEAREPKRVSVRDTPPWRAHRPRLPDRSEGQTP
jgi:hypothetical protein